MWKGLSAWGYHGLPVSDFKPEAMQEGTMWLWRLGLLLTTWQRYRLSVVYLHVPWDICMIHVMYRSSCRHRIYWDLLLAWVQNYYSSKDVILYSSVCTFSHLIPHVSAISTEHASKFNHLCYAKARPCFGLLVSLQWLKASKRIKLRVSLCFHPWLRMDPKLRGRKHPRQTRALCTLGRFSASSLQAFNLSIKVWSRQHKDLQINTLAKVPGWGLAEPHGRLHMSEKYVSKLYTLHFVSWFPFRFLQTMTFLRKVGRVQWLGITNFFQ